MLGALACGCQWDKLDGSDGRNDVDSVGSGYRWCRMARVGWWLLGLQGGDRQQREQTEWRERLEYTMMTSALQRHGNFKQMLRPPKSTLVLHGAVGCTTARKSRSGPTLQGTLIPFKSSKSTSSNSAQDNTTKGARHLSKLIPFLNTSQPLSRRMLSWWTRPKPTTDRGGQEETDMSPLVTSCVLSPEQIH